MDRWICTICYYVYDPDFGDPESNVSAGVSFDFLPEDWVCPDCGASKNEFDIYYEEEEEIIVEDEDY